MKMNRHFLKLLNLILVCTLMPPLVYAQYRLQRPEEAPETRTIEPAPEGTGNVVPASNSAGNSSAVDPKTGRPALTGGVRQNVTNLDTQQTNLNGNVNQPLFNGAALNAEISPLTGGVNSAGFNMGASTNSGGVNAAPLNLGAGRYAPAFNMGASMTNLNGGLNQGAPLQGNANSAPLQGNVNTTPLQGGVNKPVLDARATGGLTQAQLDRLANHDLVLIIDQSGSMNIRDCSPLSMGATGGALLNAFLRTSSPSLKIGRWQWCGEQTAKLAQITGPLSGKGFTVILFSQHYKVFNNVTLNQVPAIFTNERPLTNTRLGDPLRSAISDYFTRRQNSGGKVKPLGIAILSDGDPNDGSSVIDAIAEATQHMQRGEIKITFLMVGADDDRGRTFITEMYRELPSRGARFPFVRTVPFYDLEKYGLARALADALQ
jgi:hypothetical protein